MEFTPDMVGQVVAAGVAAITATVAVSRRNAARELPPRREDSEAPQDPGAWTDERVRILVRDALSVFIAEEAKARDQAQRTHNAVNALVAIANTHTTNIATLTEKCVHIANSVDALRRDQPHGTPPHGLTRIL